MQKKRHRQSQKTKLPENQLLASHNRRVGIWTSAALIFILALALVIFGIVWDESNDPQPATRPLASAIPCSNNVRCRPAFFGCIQGDIAMTCEPNEVANPTLDSRNCTLIIQDALEDMANLPPSVLLFSELINAPPGEIIGASMTIAQMQEAVDFYCPLMFNYVKCSCSWCTPCPGTQDICSMTNAQLWCSLHMRMGFSDSLIYNGTTPYWNFGFMTAQDFANQAMIVDASYRTV